MNENMKKMMAVNLDSRIMEAIKAANKAFEALPIEKEKVLAAAFGGMVLMMQIMAADESTKGTV